MKLIDDLRNLDRNNVGGWPKSVKTFFVVLVIVVIVLLGWYFYVSNQQDTLATARQQEVTLKQDFEAKQAKVVNLDALKAQLAQMNDMLSQMLRELPGKTEMPALLVNISQTAQAAGIETDLFKPQPEIPKEFYAIQPIALKMQGTYHQFGTFISGVASLPRVVILTMHDVSLSAAKSGGSRDAPPPGGQLMLEGTVQTYRYLGDEEANGKNEKAPAKQGGQ
ncbi:MAG: type 4a pilus biogenesis protein PilO [Xanthomonadales bacterium]|nr:type 4a pilus biogenesis protein PilO [Xanthomonadales bacterium]ODU94340.1 MAG: fimbrial protein [Rhodanobacter sp. SCN 66-43]OJY86947.1 MAG: fimbrial protein [Xanthomonadales bacterium 66-474]